MRLNQDLGKFIQPFQDQRDQLEQKLQHCEMLRKQMVEKDQTAKRHFAQRLRKFYENKDLLEDCANNILSLWEHKTNLENLHSERLNKPGGYSEIGKKVEQQEMLLMQFFYDIKNKIQEMARIFDQNEVDFPSIERLGTDDLPAFVIQLLLTYFQKLEDSYQQLRELTNHDNIHKSTVLSRSESINQLNKLRRKRTECHQEIETCKHEQHTLETKLMEKEKMEKRLSGLLVSEDIANIVDALFETKLWSNEFETTKERFINYFLSVTHVQPSNPRYQSFQQNVRYEIQKISQATAEAHHRCKNIVDKRGVLEKNMLRIDNEIERIKLDLAKLEEIPRPIYSTQEHELLTEECNKTINEEQLAGFGLALSSLENEIEILFKIEKVTRDKQINNTKALNLSFRRELVRCKRDTTKFNLPVFRKREEILSSLTTHDAVIIVAHTGSGKSTQVPQYLADDLHNVLNLKDKFPKIACTQPRRVACMRIAERVAKEYSGAVPIPRSLQSASTSSKVYGDRRVVAYPLFAKLAMTDQERALDTDDRVGYDRDYKKKEDRSENDHRQESTQERYSDLKGKFGDIGGWVGFHVGSKGKPGDEKKQSRKISKDTRICFVTEGLLLQKLKRTNMQTSYDCIILDEAHERGSDTDLLLAHLRDIVNNNNKANNGENLKIVIMSASINAQAFSMFFNNCPIVNCEGKMHDVSLRYKPLLNHDADDVDQSIEEFVDANKKRIVKGRSKGEKKGKAVDSLIKHVVNIIFDDIVTETVEGAPIQRATADGDVLVFLPGQSEIFKCVEEINKRALEELKEVNKIHEGKEKRPQKKRKSRNFATQRKFNTKKVVCCTNIAETSLTIPGVTYVLDSGKAKKMLYNNRLRLATLKMVDISQASAKQRKGRAGRVQPGQCYRLYSKEHHEETMEAFDEPAMKQMSIDKLYLEAMDVSRGLENIHLMKDAQPDPESIQNAKERLLNLGFLCKKNQSFFKQEVDISPDGKFALSLMGDVSLEGAKMVLAAQPYGRVCDTITLAVLLEGNIYTDEETNIERAKYTNNLGDHLTILNLYKKFEQKLKSANLETVESWCETMGLDFNSLKQISKSIDQVYKTIKADSSCSIGSLVKKEETTLRQRSKERTKHLAKKEITNLVSDPKTLMKIVIAGYFHNICVCNDPEFMKAGYSMITPIANEGEEHQGVHLLKVMLNKNSHLNEPGDIVKNSTIIFYKLFESRNGFVVTTTSSRVHNDWIIEAASKRWKERTINDIEKIKNIVQCRKLQFIGNPVLSRIDKDEIECEVEKKKIRRLAYIEKKSNAAIETFYPISEIRIYGSTKEIDECYLEVSRMVTHYHYEVLASDQTRNYPTQETTEPLCEVETGLIVKGQPKIPRPSLSQEFNKWHHRRLVLEDRDGKLTKAGILKMLEELKPVCKDETFCEPNITIDGGTFAKIRFDENDLAVKYEYMLRHQKRMGKYFSANTRVYIDQEIEWSVIDTAIYPSIEKLMNYYTSTKLVIKKETKMFCIKMRNKAENQEIGMEKNLADFQSSLDQIVERLQLNKTFGCKRIEITDLSYGEREYFMQYKCPEELWKMKSTKEKFGVVVWKTQNLSLLAFEIFGEHAKREEMGEKIQAYIDTYRMCLRDQSREYNAQIRIRSINNLSVILQNMKEIQSKNKAVKIDLRFGQNVGKAGELPIMTLVGDDKQLLQDAKQYIYQLMCCEKPLGINDSDSVLCHFCRKTIAFDNARPPRKVNLAVGENKQESDESDMEKKQKDGKIVENEAIVGDVGVRLLLCGCTFCVECLKWYINGTLENQEVQKIHEPIHCPKCNKVLMIKDLNILPNYLKEKICRKIFTNYLRARQKDGRNRERFDICRECKSIFIYDVADKGIFRCWNDKCRLMSCSVCKRRVMSNNEIDFKQHMSCWTAERCE
ncbi:uncharacterized protein [Clytia hemisphaerica]|uniref:Uncharacterized protein n=1 Tax=Clytia hemisphaerica TaxID=252671 RepID=A0A7M6DR94_9CNID